MTRLRAGNWLLALWVITAMGLSYWLPKTAIWAYVPIIGIVFGIGSEAIQNKFSQRHRDAEPGSEKWLFVMGAIFLGLLLIEVGLDGYEKTLRDEPGGFVWPAVLAIAVIRNLKVRKQLTQ